MTGQTKERVVIIDGYPIPQPPRSVVAQLVEKMLSGESDQEEIEDELTREFERRVEIADGDSDEDST